LIDGSIHERRTRRSLATKAPKLVTYHVFFSVRKAVGIRLSGAAASDPLRIEARILSDPLDMKALTEGLKFSREIGYSPAFERFLGKEVRPGRSSGMELEELVREASGNFSHQACTAKMGTDALSVVDPESTAGMGPSAGAMDSVPHHSNFILRSRIRRSRPGRDFKCQRVTIMRTFVSESG
jgi:hypothetical protein